LNEAALDALIARLEALNFATGTPSLAELLAAPTRSEQAELDEIDKALFGE
jgi:hypothetical protein